MTRDRSHLSLGLLALAAALLVAATLGGAARGAPARGQQAAAAPPAMPGELLVGFRADVSPAEQQSILKRIGAVERRSFKRIHGALAYLPGAVGGRGASGAVTRALGQLQSDARVRYAEPNYIFHADATPNDPLFNRLWGLDNSGQLVNGAAGTPDADIDAPEAWSVTTGSDNVTVAVIDTGIDSAHPDLSPQMWTNPGENCAGCRTDGIDNDGNGYVGDADESAAGARIKLAIRQNTAPAGNDRSNLPASVSVHNLVAASCLHSIHISLRDICYNRGYIDGCRLSSKGVVVRL